MRIERNTYNDSNRLKDESIFSCSSGKLGIRGNFEEGVPFGKDSIRGAYLNGFCENEKITYNEKLYGFPEEKQTIVNLPDCQSIDILTNNTKICCFDANVTNYNYALDMEKGIVFRDFDYQDKEGDLHLSFERFSSFVHPGLFIIRTTIKSISYSGHLSISSYLNGDVSNYTNSNDPRVASGSGKKLKVLKTETLNESYTYIQSLDAQTINSKRTVNVLTLLDVLNYNDYIEYTNESELLKAKLDLNIKANDEIILTKYCYYNEVLSNETYVRDLFSIYQLGYDSLKNEQIDYVKDFWQRSRIVIDSEDVDQTKLDYCLYEMLCSSGKDGKTSIAAKGLSGEGYEGHYFWDCETYIFPFFLLTSPDIAKTLLEYRYSKLEDAKAHARTLGHKNGALYPWRTITGSECSSYFPSGSAQYHINGDIARAFEQYFNVTHDYSFLEKTCEVLLETARLWMDVGHYDDDLFKIDCVTGPDEYTCLVNNNYYTNAACKNNLYQAYRFVNILKETNQYSNFVKKTNVSQKELDSFKEAASKMYLPYDEKLKIIKQDDSFLNKKKIDLASYEKEEFPLLLHYHPLYLNRHQICKQADAVLADHLFANLDSLTSKRTLDYYESVTTHDSSLSKCIFGIVASKLGDLDKTKEYLIETLSTDLDDDKGNTKDGLHIANMGGCYRMVLAGFAGVKVNDDSLSLFPMLPSNILSYSFPITYNNYRFVVECNCLGTTIKVLNYNQDINKLNIYVYGNKVNFTDSSLLLQRKTKAFIFDLDGVITDTAIYHYKAWKKIADELKIAFDEEKNEQFKGVSRKTCLELLLKWGNLSLNDEEFDKLLVRKNEIYKELLNNLNASSILPGIKESLISLKEINIKIALFSVSKNTDFIIDKLGLREYFDVMVTGNDIEKSKPNYEGYLLAADRLNVDPRLCLMVEDSASGIKGAKALSMKTIAVMKYNVENANYCIENTSKLLNIIQTIYQ